MLSKDSSNKNIIKEIYILNPMASLPSKPEEPDLPIDAARDFKLYFILTNTKNILVTFLKLNIPLGLLGMFTWISILIDPASILKE